MSALPLIATDCYVAAKYRFVPLATKVQRSKNSVYLDGTRGKITLNSANSPGTVSISIKPPCCLTTMS